MPALVSFLPSEQSADARCVWLKATGPRHASKSGGASRTRHRRFFCSSTDKLGSQFAKKVALVKLVHLWIYSNLCIVDLSSTARHCTFRPARSSQKTSGQPRGRAAARQLSSSAAAVSRGRVEPRPGRRQGSSSRKIPAVASGRKIRQRQISRSRIRDGRKCGSFGWFCQRGRRERRRENLRYPPRWA